MIFDKLDSKKKFYFHHDINIETPGEVTLKPHYHNMFEIYYITDGNVTYIIDNKTYQLLPGDIFFVPDGVIHSTKYHNSIHSRMLIHCHRILIPPSVRPILPPTLYLYRNPTIADDISFIFHKIEEEYAIEDSLSDDTLSCYVKMLFLLVARNIGNYVKIDGRNKYIEQAITYIHKHFVNNITLNDVAEICHVTPEHFSRIFKRETGFNFCEYINLLRMQKAQSLLNQSPELTIAEIASECGFNDSNYFSLKFKKTYGISPKKLQFQNRK